MARINSLKVVMVVVAVLMVSLACSFGNFIPNFGGSTPVPTLQEPIQVPVNTEVPTRAANATLVPARPTAVAGVTPPAGSIPEIADVQAGLDKLDSYRMTFNMTITGKDSKGVEKKQELKLLQEVVKSKESMRMSMQGTGWATDQGTGLFDIYQVAKTSYMFTAAKDKTKANCLSFSSDKPIFDKKQLITPEEMLGAVQNENLIARGEMVNGVKTDHYKMKKANLGFGIATSQVGEVWLAQDGGFVVKLTSQGDGEFSLSAEKITGKMVLTYDLTEVNKITQIVLPSECTTASEATKDLPVPPNATEQSSFGEMITFSSPDAVKAVADYYRKEVVVKGWKISSDSNMDTVVMISIQKDTRKFQIMITPGSNNKGASVIITKIP